MKPVYLIEQNNRINWVVDFVSLADWPIEVASQQEIEYATHVALYLYGQEDI